ncbi:annexin A7 [Strongylocentrotus purpuratus]|uniref:Annexin n=1 Tax=Strongylocentrotus purpuratus TaxID=7668 RepID=A0A7M7REQ3_STRPU|nr:annexin A7 [Strongylocentrotus purpuratus]|eukprot:XP_795341.2 PREDICTED: annexin A7 [Strongylocentrotus purpuratus]
MNNRPTVTEFEGFDKDTDVQVLRKAMKGLGTDEQAILDILCYRTNDQRQELSKHYKASYGRDLIDDLKSELKGDFEDIIVGIMTPLPLFDATCLKNAMSGAGTDEKVLLEILCARSNAQINLIKAAYKAAGYGDDLEGDLESETGGDLKRLLVGLCTGARDESDEIDRDRVEADAQSLVEAGEGQLGTDESEFQRILVAKSVPHIRAVLLAYAVAAEKTMIESISSEMSGDLEQGYLNIVNYIRNPHEYFAELLYKAMKGLGTDEGCLGRVIATRAEIDLGSIADAFQEKYGQSLVEFIEDDVGGDFKRALIALAS